MPPNWAISFVTSPPSFLVSISTIGPHHCIRNNQISWKTSLKSSKLHFRRLRFDQNNSGLMNDPDSISDPVARRLRCTESSPSARGSARLTMARLNLAQLAADDMAGGSPVLMCQLTGCWLCMMMSHLHQVDVILGMPACLLCMLMSLLRHDDIIIIRVSHMGRVKWYSSRVSPSGRRRRVRHVARVYARGQPPCR
jgi:hypothetical protein